MRGFIACIALLVAILVVIVDGANVEDQAEQDWDLDKWSIN